VLGPKHHTFCCCCCPIEKSIDGLAKHEELCAGPILEFVVRTRIVVVVVPEEKSTVSGSRRVDHDLHSSRFLKSMVLLLGVFAFSLSGKSECVSSNYLRISYETGLSDTEFSFGTFFYSLIETLSRCLFVNAGGCRNIFPHRGAIVYRSVFFVPNMLDIASNSQEVVAVPLFSLVCILSH